MICFNKLFYNLSSLSRDLRVLRSDGKLWTWWKGTVVFPALQQTKLPLQRWGGRSPSAQTDRGTETSEPHTNMPVKVTYDLNFSTIVYNLPYKLNSVHICSTYYMIHLLSQLHFHKNKQYVVRVQCTEANYNTEASMRKTWTYRI